MDTDPDRYAKALHTVARSRSQLAFQRHWTELGEGDRSYLRELASAVLSAQWPAPDLTVQPLPPGGEVPAPEPIVINLMPLAVLLDWGNGQRRFDPEPCVRFEPSHDAMRWGPLSVVGPVGEASVKLPPYVEGTIYLVLDATRLIHPGRRDLFSLYRTSEHTDGEGERVFHAQALRGWPARVLRRTLMEEG